MSDSVFQILHEYLHSPERTRKCIRGRSRYARWTGRSYDARGAALTPELIQQTVDRLIGTLDVGEYSSRPGLIQGARLQVEPLDAIMHNVTFDDSHIRLWRMGVE